MANRSMVFVRRVPRQLLLLILSILSLTLIIWIGGRGSSASIPVRQYTSSRNINKGDHLHELLSMIQLRNRALGDHSNVSGREESQTSVGLQHNTTLHTLPQFRKTSFSSISSIDTQLKTNKTLHVSSLRLPKNNKAAEDTNNTPTEQSSEDIRTGNAANRFVKQAQDSVSLWRSNSSLESTLKNKKVPASVAYRLGEPLPLYSRTQCGQHNESGCVKKSPSFDFRRPPPRPPVNCRSLITGETNTLAESERKRLDAFVNDSKDTVVERLNVDTCDIFKQHMGYATDSTSSFEADFPIAYSIITFKDFTQVEMLLRNIYSPQNVYCIHVDMNAVENFRKNITKLSKCFDNVFVSSRSVAVKWGEYSVLEADLICMKDLWKRSKKWNYFINLTGQEFPLRTNYELVQILRAFNGSNNVEGITSRFNKERLRVSGPLPHNLRPVKGGIHVILSRDFVNFTLHDRRASDVIEWSKKVQIPDEIVFSTLNSNPSLGAPGSPKEYHETDNTTNPWLARLKIWEDDMPCNGQFVHGICIFGTGDLPILATREELFVNKLYRTYQPEVIYCMEELLHNRTLEEYQNIIQFNVTYYETRRFVKEHQ